EERIEPAIVEVEPEPPAPPPPQKQSAPAPSRRAIAAPTLAPVQSHIERQTPVTAPTIRVAPTDGNAAVLGIFLEVLSMQLTSQLQMGAIRARPSSSIASLRLESTSVRNAIPSELGFQLGPVRLNG